MRILKLCLPHFILINIFVSLISAYSYSTFEIINGDFTWEEARLDASSKGGRLAVIDSATKLEAFNNFLSREGTWPQVWLGGTDEISEGNWLWLNGSPISHSYWLPSEPNNSGNYLNVYPSHSYKGGFWDDAGSTDRLSYVLEVPSIYSNSRVVTWGDYLIGTTDSLKPLPNDLKSEANIISIEATHHACAALKNDGSVVTWGNSSLGGDSSSVTSDISSGVIKIYSNVGAFAALKSDGSVVTWGQSNYGGDSSIVASELSTGVIEVFSNKDGYTFAALKDNGSVVTWGQVSDGGDSSGVASELSSGVTSIYSTERAFAALKNDGSVVTWGDSSYGGTSSDVSSQLSQGVINIAASKYSFAALKDDGSVVAWGNSLHGGDFSPYASQLTSGVSKIFPSGHAFAALKEDGSVIVWGNSLYGGDSSSVSSELSSGVSTIFSNHFAFAALKDDGSVVTWGHSSYGGDSSIVASELSDGVTTIYSNWSAFAALKDNGSVVTWGQVSDGGDSSGVASELSSGVTSIYSTERAFAALKDNGTVVTWENPIYGGDSTSVASELSNTVILSIFSTKNAFAAIVSESIDSDGDGVLDNADAFPNDPTETVDSDGDGVGDNADAFPNDPTETVDSDGDEVGDNADAFPNDPTETVDSDGDGVGDNADAFPNDPNESDLSALTSPILPPLESFYESIGGITIEIDATPTSGYPLNFTYQWYLNELPIPSMFGGTNPTYTIEGSLAFNGNYKVEVTNQAGTKSAEFEYRVFADADGDGLSDYRESYILNTNPYLTDTDSDGLNDKLDAFPNDSLGIQQDSYIIGEGHYQITPPRLDNIETNWNAYGQEFISENEVLYGFKFYLDASLLTNKIFNLNLYSANDTVNPITSVNFEATDGDWLTIYLNHPINLELGEKYLFLVSPIQPANDTWRMALSSSRNESTYEELNCTTRSIVDGVLNEQRSDGRDLFFDIIYEKDSDFDGITDNDELNIHNTNPLLKDSDNDGLDDFAEIYRFRVIWNEELYSWHECRDDALLKGGHLATFSNLSEWLVAREQLIANDVVHQGYPEQRNTVWLGGTDEISEGNWQWVTDEPFDYQLWAKWSFAQNEPDNYGGGVGVDVDYMSIQHHTYTYNEVFRAWTDHPAQGPQSNVNTRDLPHAYLLEDSTDPSNSDTDGDGLSDGDELNVYSTNPNLLDTDGDGLSDDDELNVYSTNPNLSDTDGDGLSDDDELNVYSTNPNLSDTDGDGLSDGFELSTNSYQILPAPSNGWTVQMALNEANLRGGYLARISSLAEWEEIKSLVLASSFTARFYLIDGSDVENEGNWTYSSGENILFENWADGEPNNISEFWPSAPNANFASFRTDLGEDWRWYDFPSKDENNIFTAGGLILEIENGSGTDPNDSDTDGDGLIDGDEVNLYASNPLSIDTDNDSLTDDYEVNESLTDPNDSDSDNDDLTDGYELNDSLTDPNDSDSDDDGLTDGIEINTNLTDPNDADSDDDGLNDGIEINIYSSNPLVADTSGDGFNDGFIVGEGFNPTDDYSALRLSTISNVVIDSEAYGLYTLDDIKDLRPGSTIIEVSEDQATVQLQMEESSDLQTWEDTGTPATMTIPADTDTKFFRFKMAE